MNHSTIARPSLIAALVSALLIAVPAVAADKPAKAAADKAAKPAAAGAFATVNGVAIPKTLADAFMAEQLAQGAQDTKELRDAVREELIRREVMVQESRKKGLDKKPETIAQLEMARQAILIRSLVQDNLKAKPVTEADQQAEYDRIKAQAGGNEYKSRHVLVEKEEDAKAIIEKLGKGAKFEDLAKESKDQGSKDTGGDLGWSAANAFVKPFADALGKLEKGKYTTEPVKSEFGFHVILLEDIRPIQPPPFEQVKAQLAQRLQQQRVEQMIMDLRGKAKVE